MTKYERFGLVFTKTRVYKFGHRYGCINNAVGVDITSELSRPCQYKWYCMSIAASISVQAILSRPPPPGFLIFPEIII
jgi:hypothetical protein